MSGHDGRVGLVVCRGCCCGDPRRDPGTDHAGQLRRLRGVAQARADRVEVRTSDCLGPCGQANVVVVRPSRRGRRRGGRPLWLAFVHDTAILDIIDDWVSAGGPGVARVPDQLALHAFTPPGRRRG
jgi:(2Fe-2S) ferredoxin